MKQIICKTIPVPKERILTVLEDNGISVNHYAETYFSHPCFTANETGEITMAIASLREIGLTEGAALAEVFSHIQGTGLRPCPPSAGLFLRLAWKDQPESSDTVLSGTHSAPDQSVTVLSAILEQRDDFPKGLYLRNVAGRLWLRGYVCDETYRFPADALFAFEKDPAQ